MMPVVSEPDRKPMLFLSHAWEDKESFIEPLYQALKDEYDVWYDKARITLGDSIYEKISEGIRECDFGVVVFSPAFLRKNWTQEEFNGLKALQTEKRKVILPILHKLTIDDLKAKWPIEAGKFAISSSEGIAAIVEAIHYAVGADRQHKSFAEDALKKRFEDFKSKKELARINDHLSKSAEGVTKAHNAACELLHRVKAKIDQLSQGSNHIAATVHASSDGTPALTLRSGEYRILIRYINPASDSTTDAMLDILYLHRAPLGDELTTLAHHALFPLFTLKGDVVWGFDLKDGRSNDQVAL